MFYIFKSESKSRNSGVTKMKDFKGILPAVITPLKNDGKLNEVALIKHLDFMLNNGVHGIYLGGSTGEGIVLPAEEREKLVDTAISHISRKDVIKIVQVGSIDGKTAIRLAKHAERAGADAISSIPPFYYRVDKDAIYNYYKKLANTVDLPLFVYNIPETTGVIIDTEDMRVLMKIDNIKGIKYSSIDISEMRKMIDLVEGRIKVFFGVDQILAAALLMGADGGIGGTYNIMPGKYVDVYEAAMKNNWKKAAEIQFDIAKFYHICIKYKNPIAVMKAVLSVIYGIDIGGVTSPLNNFSCEEKTALIMDLKENNFFQFIGVNINFYNKNDAVPWIFK